MGGNTSQAGSAGTAARRTLSVGGRTWATVPLLVFGTGALMYACGAQRRITTMDTFLRLIGRGHG